MIYRTHKEVPGVVVPEVNPRSDLHLIGRTGMTPILKAILGEQVYNLGYGALSEKSAIELAGRINSSDPDRAAVGTAYRILRFGNPRSDSRGIETIDVNDPRKRHALTEFRYTETHGEEGADNYRASFESILLTPMWGKANVWLKEDSK